MNKERLDQLWKRVLHVGKVDRLDENAMMALGSVFGEMRKTIERQRENDRDLAEENFTLRTEIEQLKEEIERLKNDCAYWKFQPRK